MKHRALFLLLFSLFCVASFSQSAPKIQWQKCYGGSGDDELSLDYGFAGKPRSKIISRDKNYLFVAGSTASSNGDINAAIQGQYDIWVAKIDLSGNIVWRTTITGHGYEEFRSLTETSDGNLLVIGSSYIWPNGGTHDALVTKLDRNGGLVWKKYYGGSQDDYGVRIIETKDGNYAFIGSSQSSDGDLNGQAQQDEIWIGKISKDGASLWHQKYPGVGVGQVDFGVALNEDSQGNLIYGANSMDDSSPNSNLWNYDILVAKITNNGDTAWRKTLTGSASDYLYDIELLPSNEILLAGSASSTNGAFSGPAFGGGDGFLMKLNASGAQTWFKRFGGLQSDGINDVVVLPNQTFLAVGTTSSSNGDLAGNTVRGFDAWVFNVTGEGQVLWSKTYGGSNKDNAVSVDYFTENDFVFFGETSSTDFDVSGNHGDSDFWLVKLGNTNTIKGTVFYDFNFNGTKDNGDNWAENATVTSVKNGYEKSTFTRNGSFSIATDTGSFSTKVSQLYYTAVPVSQPSTFPTYLNKDSFSFALQPIANKQDLVVGLFPVTAARLGITTTYRLAYKNVGTTTISTGEISFQKDARVSFLSSSPAFASSNGDVYKWSYSNLQPGDTGSVFIYLKAMPPGVNTNDTVSMLASISPVINDETPANDTARLKQVVVGSYDPNDKSESNSGFIPLSFVTNGNFLQYTVRFQNTGTDTAFAVVVRDTLSSRLDASTLEVVATSHPYNLSINNGVNLAWRFDNILLPDSSKNEPASHGYVVYRVRPKNDLAKGEIVHNTASIYFDYNLPVITNDATTQVQATLVTLPQGLLHFYGSQQGAQVSLFWEVTEGTELIRFEIEKSEDGKRFDLIGNALATANMSSYRFADKQATQAVVYYRLKLLKAGGGFRYSPVLMFQNQSGNTTALTVYPNPLTAQGYAAFYSNKEGAAELQLFTPGGSLINREAVVLAKGQNVFAISRTPRMVPGQYLLRLVCDGQVKVRAFVVQ